MPGAELALCARVETYGLTPYNRYSETVVPMCSGNNSQQTYNDEEVTGYAFF
jgi:hypothetical protein